MTTGLGGLMSTYAASSVSFVRGEGSRLYDSCGRSYLDFLSGLAVTSLGHAEPHVTRAIADQAARLSHVSNLFGNEHAGPLAAEIDRLVGDGEPLGGSLFLCNSGAEAIECALKLARRHGGRGRHVVVSAYGSFHGRSLAALAATGQPDKHEPFQPLPEGFRHVAFGDTGALDSAMDPSVAAVLLEVIQGEAGVVPAPPRYLAAARRICDDTGALLMLDEVQTGLARTGRWFAFQHEGVAPDVVTVAKALGNGMPIGACWARAEVASAFEPGDHGSTFGGQPLACAAARATLTRMKEIDAPRLAAAAGEELARRLGALGAVAAVRGRGLLLGVVLRAGLDARQAARRCLEAGVVVNAPVAGILRLAPPLTISAAEIDEGVVLIEGALA
ncbi:MAG: aspartate aminotransferase family protein [Acidimicrobiales bacterium]